MSKRYLGGDIYFEQKETSQEFSEESGGGGGGSSTLSGLTDVDISNPTDGETLVYNATSGKWENGAGGGGAFCVDDTLYPHSVTIDGVDYDAIYLEPFSSPYNFFIVPKSVIDAATPFYVKNHIVEEDVSFITTKFPSYASYISAGSYSDDPGGIDYALTVTDMLTVCRTEFDDFIVLIPDTADFKTVRIPR